MNKSNISSFLKLVLLSALMICGLFIGSAVAKNKLVAGGCVTEYYLMKDLTNEFNSDELSIEVRKTGNMKGMMHFAKGDLDFAFLSMPHMMLAKNMNMPHETTAHMKSIEIAQEPILVVVNKNIQVDNLTKEQVTAIYNGKITNWKELGGQDLPIKPASLNEKAESGLWAAFKKVTIGMMNNFEGNYTDLKGPSSINNFLAYTSGGITYIGYSNYDPSVSKSLSIDDIAPTMENFINGTYPLTAKYYLTYNKVNPGKVMSFIDFIYSPKGKSIISQQMIPSQKQEIVSEQMDMQTQMPMKMN